MSERYKPFSIEKHSATIAWFIAVLSGVLNGELHPLVWMVFLIIGYILFIQLINMRSEEKP